MNFTSLAHTPVRSWDDGANETGRSINGNRARSTYIPEALYARSCCVVWSRRGSDLRTPARPAAAAVCWWCVRWVSQFWLDDWRPKALPGYCPIWRSSILLASCVAFIFHSIQPHQERTCETSAAAPRRARRPKGIALRSAGWLPVFDDWVACRDPCVVEGSAMCLAVG